MLYACDEQTIIAQCTPKGPGAIALLRISGITSFEVADALAKLPEGKSISSAKSHTIIYGWIVDEFKQPIDQVLFLVMEGPKTFTGQNTVEITCHNNSFVIERIIQQAIMHGARLAHEGEFSKRAVLNDKIDLIQAEAIYDLIHANSQTMLKQALAQVEGSLSEWIQTIEQQLLKALAFSDASFEFIDEEDQTFGKEIVDIIDNSSAFIADLKKTFDQQQHIRQGIRIAFIGSVNAGKSSLFNALLNINRAIVTDIPGTTRDTIEGGSYREGNYWTLIDTAGLRNTDDIIEQEGIKKSFAEAQLADIILLIVDQSRLLSESEEKILSDLYKSFSQKIIMIATKADLPSAMLPFLSDKSSIMVSAKKKKNIEQVEKAIQQSVNHIFKNINSPFLLNKRQFSLLQSLENALLTIKKMVREPNVAFELVSAHINEALAHVSELTGKTISEKSLDAVFKEFCVGK